VLSWASLGSVTREVASIIARPVPSARFLTYFLNGSWRRECPPLSLTPTEVARAASLLIGSGAAALGWRRVKETPALKGCAEAQELCQSGQILVLEDARLDGVRPRPRPVRPMFASWRSKITCASSSCIG
jgi:hypothetical protein